MNKLSNTNKDTNPQELITTRILTLLRQITTDNISVADNLENIYVAYSGGIDSSVLLHSCVLLRDDKLLPSHLSHATATLRAWHINHQVSKNADTWQGHCEKESKRLMIPLRVDKVEEEQPAGESTEMFARRSRYDIWYQHLQPSDILLQAHHMRDQAETLLLRIVRASPNLKGMPQVRLLDLQGDDINGITNKAVIARPLLELDKQVIDDYAKQYKIKYIQDDSNQDTNVERNFIRTHILPQLEKKWPSAVVSMAKSAARLNDYQQIITEKQQLLLEQFMEPIDSEGGNSGSKYLNTHDNPLLNKDRMLVKISQHQFELLIRAWLQECRLPPPTTIALTELRRQIQESEHAMISWQEGEIHLYNNQLYAMAPLRSKLNFDTQQEGQDLREIVRKLVQQDMDEGKDTITKSSQESYIELPLPLGKLIIEVITNSELAKKQSNIDYLVKLSLDNIISDDRPLLVKSRRGGEQIRFLAQGPSHKLKKLYQEHHILPWLRDYLPLVYLGDELVAVPSIGCVENYQCSDRSKQKCLLLKWQIN